MMSSHSRILSSLSSKENMSPRRKRSSGEAFCSNYPENASKRRIFEAHPLDNMKSKPLLPLKSSNKLNIKKQSSIKNYYQGGLKSKPGKTMKILDENKEKVKQKQQQDTFSMMCSEEAPEKYWELLAEERRKGLEKALNENKELADEIREKDETIKELRTEVSELQETAKHAEYLATVLEELGKECNVSDDEEEADSESEDEVFEMKDISDSYPESEEDEESGDKSSSTERSKGNKDEQNQELLKSDSSVEQQEDVTKSESLSWKNDNEVEEESDLKKDVESITEEFANEEKCETNSCSVISADNTIEN